MRPAAQRARRLRDRLLIAASLVAGAALAWQMLGGADEEIEATVTDDDRGYYLHQTRLTEFGPGGAPRIVLQADTIEQRLADQNILLRDLTLDYSTEQAGKWRVTAAEGRLPQSATALLLSGDVRVTGNDARGTALIRTDQLSYDTETSVIQTAEPVTVDFGKHHLEGRGLRVVLNDGTLRLESNIHGQFVP